jgi:prephenate dehydrogenase
MPSIVNTSRIAIVGLGQLGTSLAMRLKELGCRELLAVSRREDSLRTAVERNIIDAGSTEAGDILPVVDLVFLCLPLTPTIAFVEANRQHFRFGGLVTDVGSVKGSIVRAVRPILMAHGTWFIGSHPMAGSEKSGMDCGRADLYQNATVFITPTPEDELDAIELLATFWREIGALPVELDADRHDLACAHSSHLAHLVSAALVRGVLGRGDAEANRIACAGGFRDVSRIAASSADMWVDICRHNREAIQTALTHFGHELGEITAALDREDYAAAAAFLQRGKELRDDWFAEFSRTRGLPS